MKSRRELRKAHRPYLKLNIAEEFQTPSKRTEEVQIGMFAGCGTSGPESLATPSQETAVSMTLTEQFLAVHQSLHRKYDRDPWIHTTRAPRLHECLPSQVLELTLRPHKTPSY